mmetsp:Transcript_85302/g.238900  ORF Transcript_85302/g.238900 Transcript_85302/m.238900 type:complete len:219 (+) Transcript_85302:2-658(+)
MRSLIIFLTFAKGSAAARSATAESTRLLCSFACWRRYTATRCCEARSVPEARNCAKEAEAVCAKVGRCFSALPCTELLEMISIAFVIASSSSARSCCRDSKSVAFCSHVAVKSAKYFSSASFVVVVSCKSPSASALACKCFALLSDFSSRSCVDCSICAVRSCTNISWACFEFISSFSKAVRSSTNLSWSFSNISMTPWDWNSYPEASGAETSRPWGS